MRYRHHITNFWISLILMLSLEVSSQPLVIKALSPFQNENPVNSSPAYPIADSWQLPLTGNWNPLTQDFNVWNANWNGYHLGEDKVMSTEVPVYAAANGHVRYSGSGVSGYGNLVIIEHTLPDNSIYISLYGHLKSQDRIANDVDVAKGTLIGRTSSVSTENGGYSFIHLHFGIREGAYSTTQYTCAGKTLWVYVGYSRACDQFSPTHWRKGSEFVQQHGGTIATVCQSPSNGSPRDAVVLNNRQVTFSWNPPSCNGLDSYTFRVSNHSDIDNPPWIIDHGVSKDAGNTSEAIPAQYEKQTLYWAIRPHNSAGYGAKGGPWAFSVDTSTPPVPTPLPTGTWQISYYRNKELSDLCAMRSVDATFIFFDWGESAPTSGCNTDNWSAHFTRRVHLLAGSYTFAVEADDWGRFYVNSDLVVNKWNGVTQHYESRYLNEGDYDLTVDFADTLGSAKMSAWWYGPGYSVPHDLQDNNQWYANYWLNRDQWWDPYASLNEGSGKLQHDWGYGSPGWNMPPDNFSAKFRRQVYFECGRYRFQLNHNDGAKLSVDGTLILDRWGTVGSDSIDVDLPRANHQLQVDYFENGGAANVSLDWQLLGGCAPAVPSMSSPSYGTALAWDADVTFSWQPVANANSYYVHLWGGPGVDINSDWISSSEWHMGHLWPGQYYWTVRSHNDYGDSSVSGTSPFTVNEGPPASPDNFTISNVTSSQIDLSWVDAAYNTSGFNIYRWNGTTFVYLNAVGSAANSYSDSNLNCGSDYYYEVAAYNNYGESTHAGWIMGTTATCPLANDDLTNAKSILSLPYNDYVDTTSASVAYDDQPLTLCNRGVGYATVWYKISVSKDSYLSFDTFNSTYDTMLAVWRGQRGNLSLIACNDDYNGTQSSLVSRLNAGVTYYIEVMQYQSAAVQLNGSVKDKSIKVPQSTLAGGYLELHVTRVFPAFIPLALEN